MTYCLAMRLDEGLVFLADTRTNWGIDEIGTYRKLHVIQPVPDRIFVLQSAGNLATTQQVLDRVHQDLAGASEHESLSSVTHLFEAALYLGRLVREVTAQHREALERTGTDASATFILGGQIGPEAPDILMVHSEGNYTRASEERPFLQIGESKYGKFMLELAARVDVDLASATRIGLGSMMSTAQANLSVGPPYDVGTYRTGSFELEELRVEASSPVLARLQEQWDESLLRAVSELPDVSRDDVDADASQH